MRVALVATAACMSIVGLSIAQDVSAAIRKSTHIPAQHLDRALQLLARERGLVMAYRSEIVAGRETSGASGELTSDEALRQLLTGTGLSYRYLDDKTVTIESAAAGATTVAQSSSASTSNDNPQEDPRRPSERFRVAQLGQSTNQALNTVSGGDSSANTRTPATTQEVVVTAQKREERLQDVPIPVSVLNATALSENNQTRLRDYFETVPGFTVSPGPSAGNQQMLAIRGISSGAFGNPTVGITVDDVPFGAFTREYAPDIDPSDLARVEVLRGPQGTLYGASSMGGLLKYVTVDPSTDALSGRLEAGVNTVHNGNAPCTNFRGSINVPVTDTLALRASAFTREDAGYIDNPVLGNDGVNEDRTSGGRLSGLWRFAPQFSLKLSALYQHLQGNGLSEVDFVPGLGDLQQSYIRNVGGFRQTIQAYSAIATGKVGAVDLTSVTGYNVFDYLTSNDYTYLLGPTAHKLFGVTGGPIFASGNQSKLTQEVRASLPIGERFEWLMGGFYSHENTPLIETEGAENTATGAYAGSILTLNIPIKLTEYALFTDFTVHFTDQFDIQVGGRESRLQENFAANSESGAALAKPVIVPAIKSNPDVFTYLVTPQLKLTPDLMLYGRVASGYRPGRSNSFNPDPLTPRTANPDKTQNYEIGMKGDVLDRLLSFDASVYYISWKDIQISLFDPRNSLSYYANGSDAKSQGVELSVEVRPLEGLKLAAWGSYDDAVLTQGFPANTAAYGPEGSRLPYGARFSGNLSVDDEFSLIKSFKGFAGVSAGYIGDRLGTFVATPARAYYPAYAKTDLHLGVRNDDWTFTLFANNVTDRRGLLGGGAGTYPPYAYLYIQPRTIGLSIVRKF